ncbi:hypothetical protein VT84_31365 [Gemmata sp. SH-PL17]|nr:hypothetical protein VT84_31365 [Gemmata sp. SH-PL17]
MSWKADSGAAFSGGSGQMAVIGELLHRKCNAAIPHVDIGTDVFAFRDDREEVARIQVKTSPGKLYKNGKGYSAKFGIPMKQLERTDEPPLFYALAVRLDGGWGLFVVIGRTKLKELWNAGCGSKNNKSGDLELYIQFRPENEGELKAFCGKFDLTAHINAWESLPPLKAPVPINAEEHEGGVGRAEVHIEEIAPERP